MEECSSFSQTGEILRSASLESLISFVLKSPLLSLLAFIDLSGYSFNTVLLLLVNERTPEVKILGLALFMLLHLRLKKREETVFNPVCS